MANYRSYKVSMLPAYWAELAELFFYPIPFGNRVENETWVEAACDYKCPVVDRLKRLAEFNRYAQPVFLV
jgi:hypothetical protein